MELDKQTNQEIKPNDVIRLRDPQEASDQEKSTPVTVVSFGKVSLERMNLR